MSESARAQPARRPGGALFVATAILIYLSLLNSLLALHVFPALAGLAVVLLAGLIARKLGGGRFAQDLATLVAPSFVVMGTFLSMDAFDQLWWVLASYLLLLIFKRDRLWLVFGLVAGLGLLTKIGVLYFGFAVFVALGSWSPISVKPSTRTGE